MVHTLVEFLRENFSAEVGVILAATLPVTELRAAIPLAISQGMPPLQAFFLAVIGNLLPVPFLLWLLPKLMDSLTRHLWIGRQFDRWVQRTRRRSDKVEKYGAVGLILFTAIPLPTTGAWSASLAAVLFHISWRRAIVAITFGVLLAGVAITLLSMGLFG